MLYSELNDGQRTMIETDAVFLADYSESVDTSGVVVHALRLKKDSEALQTEELRSKGYQVCTPAVWFEFCTANMTLDEAWRFAESAANS